MFSLLALTVAGASQGARQGRGRQPVYAVVGAGGRSSLRLHFPARLRGLHCLGGGDGGASVADPLADARGGRAFPGSVLPGLSRALARDARTRDEGAPSRHPRRRANLTPS